ncbi:PTS fructose transporter subunit IIB [Pectinatus brassicae]|uniref:PTS system fructose-specific IIB component n=1 Tax=Pectinatus brassicae TaxID=862415 RepID=A0A840UPZ8_9FIRM|nr:fructose PTS transporter subunit IIB [Pectinatus brassicae]MBB5336272.1 PTS system fructose-specific IIB component [Pectinatus brassicae]
MNIVGVAACTSGIAHTYIAKKKLVTTGEALGHNIHIETQGTIGTEDKLSKEEITAADVVIIAADIKINGMERFKGKRVVEVPTSIVIKSPKGLITKIATDLGLS